MEKKTKRIISVYEWLESSVFAVAVVVMVFTFIIKTYTVNGSSMSPNFETGDIVLVCGFLYSPKVGDVVVIDQNNSYGEPLIKRVIATENQTVDIDSSGRVTVDGADSVDVGVANSDNLHGDVQFPVTVPEGMVFVMGDNRMVSLDSRFSSIGFIDERSILGKEITALGKAR